jgi:hypothetical protein
MNLQFYKGNKKITGTACSFQAKGASLFVNFIKQHSWNEAKNLGSFRENAKNPEKSGVVKFTPTEAAGIVDAIDRNAEYSYYHTTKNGNSMGKFCPYIREGKQIGYSFNATKENKGDTVNKVGFLIGFSFAEAILVKQFLLRFISESFVKIEENKENPEASDAQEVKKPIYNKVQINQSQSEAEAQAEELIF